MNKVGAPVFYWKLPCIELHEFLCGPKDELQKKFKEYSENLEHSSQYFLGVTKGLQQFLQGDVQQKGSKKKADVSKKNERQQRLLLPC